jgi:hypothetical protein
MVHGMREEVWNHEKDDEKDHEEGGNEEEIAAAGLFRPHP